jgi:hypothetical protein
LYEVPFIFYFNILVMPLAGDSNLHGAWTDDVLERRTPNTEHRTPQQHQETTATAKATQNNNDTEASCQLLTTLI